MISVIMGIYRESPDILLTAVKSILSQNYKNIEIIAVLDDPNNIQLKRIMTNLAIEDSRIHFFVNNFNMGLAKTLNRALSLSKGEYIARMDADDIAFSTRLQNQLDWLTTKQLDLVGGNMQMIDEKGNLIYSIQQLPITEKHIKKGLCYGQVIPHPTWLVKREVYDHLCGYRNVPLAEDYDFVIRAVLQGYRCGNVPELVLKYRMTSESISRSNLYLQYNIMKLLSRSYKGGKAIKDDQILELQHWKPDSKESRRYAEANVILNTMLFQLENGNYSGFLINGVNLLFKSRAFLDKIWRFFILNCLADKNMDQ